MAATSPPRNPAWPQAMATVTTCKYDAGAGRAMAFGLPTARHFQITYNYWAPNAQGQDELHTGQFSSPKAIPQNTLFPITYNPEAPHENTHSASQPFSRSPLIALGLIGSVVLSLAWFLMLRGCR